MATVTPVDFKVVYTTDPRTGQLTVDLAQASNGDLAVVAGIDLLIQTVTRFMLMRVGSYPFRPTYGDPVLDLPGQAMPTNPTDEITGLVQMAEATFTQAQAQAAALGYLSPAETADRFSAPTIYSGTKPGQYILTFNVISRAGQTGTVVVPVVAG